MTAEAQDFKIYAGDGALLDFTVKDGSGNPINISSVSDIVWTAQRDLGGSPVISKSKAAGGIMLIGGGTTGQFRVTLAAADTQSLTGYYIHEAVTLDISDVPSTVATGRMQVGRAPVWTYSGDPNLSARDAVRFYISDTDAANPLVYDGEIDFLLTKFAGPLYAAAQAARNLSGKFAKQVTSKRVGDLSLTYSNQATAYAALAEELESQAAIHGSTMYIGGVSKSDMASVAAQSDRVKQPFTIKQFDMPGLKQPTGGSCE